MSSLVHRGGKGWVLRVGRASGGRGLWGGCLKRWAGGVIAASSLFLMVLLVLSSLLWGEDEATRRGAEEWVGGRAVFFRELCSLCTHANFSSRLERRYGVPLLSRVAGVLGSGAGPVLSPLLTNYHERSRRPDSYKLLATGKVSNSPTSICAVLVSESALRAGPVYDATGR